jgi:MoxR-like ATPase
MDQVIWPRVEDHIPNPDVDYVDIHDRMHLYAKIAAPEEWVNGEKDAPPSRNILFNGPHGVGKSLLAAHLTLQIGERLGTKVPMLVVECSLGTKEWKLNGTVRQIPDGSTPFIAGPFPASIHLANQARACVLVAEEISSLNPEAQKMFNRMTDWRRSIDLPETGKQYRLDPGCRVIVIGCMNPTVYGGVHILNQDLRSRFFIEDIPHPNIEEEKEILQSICPYADRQLIELSAQLASDSRTDATEYQLAPRDMAGFLTTVHTSEDLKFALSGIAALFEGKTERRLIHEKIWSVFKVKMEN